jgi:membrane protease YdiL (CAAX protease family)
LNSDAPRPAWLAQFASIAEIGLVLLVGNIVAAILLGVLLPDETRQLADDLDADSLYPGAAVSALTLTVRFGLMIGIAAALLWWRRRQTLRDHGLTRAGRPVGELVVAGIVLYAVASLPLHMVKLVNAAAPLGEGLAIWSAMAGKFGRPDFWALMLAGSIILPPLYEETLMRGYMRGRLQENYGPLGAVIVSSFLFALAHGHFYQADALVLLSLGSAIFAALCWAYSVVRTGSLIPAMIAHGLGNTPVPDSVRNHLLLVATSIAVIVLARRALAEQLSALRIDWRAADKTATAFGVGVTVLFLVPLLSLNAMGRNDLLVPLGVLWLITFLVAWTVAVVREDRRRGA